MIRWSILSACLIALFWTIWYFVNGEVPVVTSIKINDQWSIALPFPMSRWWDVLIGPIWSVAIITIFKFVKQQYKSDDMVLVFVVGLGAGFSSGLIFGLGFGLIFGLVFGLVFGLGLGLGFGLGVGLGFGLGVGLIAGLVFGLGVGVRWVTGLNWKKVGDWLTGK